MFAKVWQFLREVNQKIDGAMIVGLIVGLVSGLVYGLGLTYGLIYDRSAHEFIVWLIVFFGLVWLVLGLANGRVRGLFGGPVGFVAGNAIGVGIIALAKAIPAIINIGIGISISIAFAIMRYRKKKAV